MVDYTEIPFKLDNERESIQAAIGYFPDTSNTPLKKSTKKEPNSRLKKE
ncbi:7161_t:CDS:2 [Rhizophagus irregularis]|nr:7161_t:CDS:2 [Rhizophagus irregularis]